MIRLPALPKTKNANGDLDKPVEQRRKFYCYVFTPMKSIDSRHLTSVAESLAGTHPNIGDLMLKIAAKLTGVRNIESWAVQYLDADNTVRLNVTQDGKTWGGARHNRTGVMMDPAFPPTEDMVRAFPGRKFESRDWWPGMMLRDYFAAHAPPIPDWWMDTVPSKPQSQVARDMDGWSAERLELWGGWRDWLDEKDIPADVLHHFKETMARLDKETSDYVATLHAYYLKRETAWRFHYADGMIAAREGK